MTLCDTSLGEPITCIQSWVMHHLLVVGTEELGRCHWSWDHVSALCINLMLPAFGRRLIFEGRELAHTTPRQPPWLRWVHSSNTGKRRTHLGAWPSHTGVASTVASVVWPPQPGRSDMEGLQTIVLSCFSSQRHEPYIFHHLIKARCFILILPARNRKAAGLRGPVTDCKVWLPRQHAWLSAQASRATLPLRQHPRHLGCPMQIYLNTFMNHVICEIPHLCISFSLLCNFKDTLQWNECIGWAEGVCQVTKSSGHSVKSN